MINYECEHLHPEEESYDDDYNNPDCDDDFVDNTGVPYNRKCTRQLLSK